MAKLETDEIDKIVKIIDDFIASSYTNQVISSGKSPYDKVFKKLEELRHSLILQENLAFYEKFKLNMALSNVTHDLKTPIAIISGYSECLQDGINDKDYATLIKAKADELNDIVQNILSTLRQTHQSAKDRMRIVDTSIVINDLLYKEKVYADNLKVKLRIGKIVKCPVYVEEDGLENIITNVLNNAIKYAKPNGTVKLSTFKTKTKYVIKVKDNGFGISDKDLPHIFDMYYSSDKARKYGGTGVGLAIAKQKVESFGGQIYCQSKINKGTTFTIILPIFIPKQPISKIPAKELIITICRIAFMPFMYLYDIFNLFFIINKIIKDKINILQTAKQEVTNEQ